MKIQKVKIKDLKPAEYNPRKSSKEQEENLRKSLEKFGVVEPVIINKHKDRNNIIIGGHFRIRELKKLGHKEVDCVIVDLPLEEERELNIRLNANAGSWDESLLADHFNPDDLVDWGLDEFDWDEEEVSEVENDEDNTPVVTLVKCPGCNKVFDGKANKAG